MVESLSYGTIYAFTVRTVDKSGNKSLGSLIVESLAKQVDDLDLAQYITAPVANAAPDTRAIVGTQYTGSVVWARNPGAIPGNFLQGTVYRALVTLTANGGYTFAGLEYKDSFKYSGATSVTTGLNGSVTIIFPALNAAWYVASHGSDAGGTADGRTAETAVNTVTKALALIKDAHTAAKLAAPTAPNGLAGADIVVIGTSGDTKVVGINNTSSIYPLITLRGMSPALPGILNADKSNWTTATYRVLEVSNGADVTLGNDLTITGGGKRSLAAITGPGVYVHDTSRFTMNGGSITNNTTTTIGGVGPVTCTGNSTFTMNSGIISHNFSHAVAGVIITNNTTFTMTGGTITNNESDWDGAGVAAQATCTFTMTGGTISDNTCNLASGGGVFITGSFIMSGGAITGNTAPRGGGGVAIGVGGIFTMSGGLIMDNTSGMDGGGVRLHAENTSFTMQGGTIAGNTAAAAGGGVAVLGAGVFTKAPFVSGGSSGIIYGNNGGANSNTAELAGVYLQDMGHAVYVETGPKTRETTVMPDQHLDSTVAGTAGGWVD
jgi:hypothetical protein